MFKDLVCSFFHGKHHQEVGRAAGGWREIIMHRCNECGRLWTTLVGPNG